MHRDEIPPGTLYLLILRTLARSREMHGFEIANSIQRVSDNILQVEEGSLYPALQRMLIKQLAREMSQFERVIGAITRVIEAV